MVINILEKEDLGKELSCSDPTHDHKLDHGHSHTDSVEDSYDYNGLIKDAIMLGGIFSAAMAVKYGMNYFGLFGANNIDTPIAQNVGNVVKVTVVAGALYCGMCAGDNEVSGADDGGLTAESLIKDGMCAFGGVCTHEHPH